MSSGDFDVVVVGAGAAGLSAGRRLMELGLTVQVFEAADRRGGRAFTETATFGMPFDRGCHWLHSASVNPYRRIADDLGHPYEVRTTRRSMGLFLSGKPAPEAVRAEAMQAIEDGFAAADAAGERGEDVSALSVLDPSDKWFPLVDHWMRLLSALDPDQISTLDLSRYHDTHENYPVLDGYGALVAAHGADVPVRLSCPVTEIDSTGSLIRVTTSEGTVTARAVIVTASTSVLASGAIRFLPGLPADVEEAIAACPLGTAEKVAFQFDGPIEGIEPTTYVETFDPANPSRKPINFTINPFGRPMAVGQLGGSHARDLEAAGEAAMVDFATGGLVDIFGSGIRKRIVKTTTTHWISDPLVKGAYSCALPGMGDKRLRLLEPIGERMFLAGEHASKHAFSTAHGAHLSGIAAAEAAAGAVASRTAAV